MLNLATALVAVGALYFLLTERVLPLLQSEPVRVHEGGTLTESFAFRPLGMERPKTVDLRHIPDEWPVLLLVFNSTCPACYANLPAWRRAIDAAGRRVTVLAVAIESDRSAAQSYATRELPQALAVEPVEPMELTGTLGIDEEQGAYSRRDSFPSISDGLYKTAGWATLSLRWLRWRPMRRFCVWSGSCWRSASQPGSAAVGERSGVARRQDIFYFQR